MYWPKVHGFLMWASFGFLLPLGLIIIRFSKSIRQGGVKSPRQLEGVRYAHIVIQMLGIILATVGGAVALDKFGDEFRYTHQRLGLALLVLVWLQFFVGVIRPTFGSRVRPFWYGLHWILGTGAAVLGFISIFIGMHVYELISRKSLRTFNILFSIQLGIFSVIYLLQDRWDYLRQQGQLPQHISPSAKTSSGGV